MTLLIDYCVQFKDPQGKKDIEKLEQVLLSAIKRGSRLEHRAKEQDGIKQDKRRLRQDLVAFFLIRKELHRRWSQTVPWVHGDGWKMMR